MSDNDPSRPAPRPSSAAASCQVESTAICSHVQHVRWGEMSMVDAERRLLEAAVQDEANSFFALLSERREVGGERQLWPFSPCPPSYHISPMPLFFPHLLLPHAHSPSNHAPGRARISCIPLWPFDYVYSYIASSSASFVDASVLLPPSPFPLPHTTPSTPYATYADPYSTSFGRYIPHIFMPVIRRHQFLKGNQVRCGAVRLTGNQWFILQRRHAEAVVRDTLHYTKHNVSCALENRSSKRPFHACINPHMHQPPHAISLPALFLPCPPCHAPHTPCHAPPCILPPTPRNGPPCHAAAQMTDPRGISRYPTTFTDWSANEWHPSLYLGANMTDQVITTIK
ncbi:unnamed protein product [Closterium sp. Naga37s-1]|nr:unnamed protein product [Closterium sp. Naga37s-1]